MRENMAARNGKSLLVYTKFSCATDLSDFAFLVNISFHFLCKDL